MASRLFSASLARRPVPVMLASLAVAIGTSVAAALLHVSGDVSRKLTHELRSLGPNLLVLPAENLVGPDAGFLDLARSAPALERAGIHGVPVLHAVARLGERRVPIAGADLAALGALHPSWKIPPRSPNWIGARLRTRLGAELGGEIVLTEVAGSRSLAVRPGGVLEAGGSADETWWLPLEDVQRLTGLEGKASVLQARLGGGTRAVESAAALAGSDRALRAVPLHALSETEGVLLSRMRRIMSFVTLAALFAAGLCAFGTLTDLALERRRELALLKALGATRRHIAALFLAESAAIGLAGGAFGWLLGVFFAELIGRQVFGASIALHPDVPLLVLGLALAVALIAGLGPLRLALSIEPATALKGD